MTVEFTDKQVRKIVREEILRSLREAVDHEGITSVVSSASKLLKAIAEFQEDAAPAAVNAISPAINDVVSRLEDMVSNPGGYVERPSTQKIVSLRAQSSEE